MLGFALLMMKHQLSGNQFNAGIEKVTASNLNGMYEGIVNLKPGYTKSRNSLIRIHIYVYNFKKENLRDKITLSTRERVFAQPVLMCKEVFHHDKKGSKPPEREYISGYIYLSGNDLEISTNAGCIGVKDKVENVYNPIIGYTRKNTGILEKMSVAHRFPFTIHNSDCSEIEVTLVSNVKSQFVKKTSYRELPSIFSPYLDFVMNQNQNASKKFILANNGYGTSSPYLYAKNIKWSDSDIDIYFANIGWNVAKDNPSSLAVKKLESELIKTVENDMQGLHTNLMYFPKLQTMRVHLADPDVSNQANLFNLRIAEKQGETKYVLEYTKAGDSYIQRAVLADKEKALAEQKRKEIELQRAQEQMALHQIRTDLYKSKGFVIKPLSFWRKYPLTVSTLIAIHEGDFSLEKNEELARALFLMYMKRMNESCRNLLPPNMKKIDYTYYTEKEEYAYTRWDGGFEWDSWEDVYETVQVAHKGVFYLDPRFEETYNEVSNIYENTYVGNLFNPGFNPFQSIAEMKELNSFLNEIDCNKEDMSIIGENLLRFLNGKKSLQGEKGITF
jgi:hypothetical protein